MFNLLTTKQAFLDAQGNPLNGGRLWTKVSGSNTNKATFRDSDGAVANTNPIILDSRGELPFGVYGTTGPYRITLTTSGDVTDPPTSPIWGPRDGVSGINDFVPSGTLAEEWNPTGLAPTFISATSFSVTGDQTALFEPKRRVRSTVGAGNRYGTIQSSTFGTVTTVILVNDSTTGLDASLSAVAVGRISATNTSQPSDSGRGLDVASAGTLTLPANADRFNITGTATITALANSWTGRRVFLTHAGVQGLTHSASFVLPGAVNAVTSAGDETTWEQTTSAPIWKLINYSAAAALRSMVTVKKEVTNISVVNTVATTDIANVSIPGGTFGTDGIVTLKVAGNILQNSGVSNQLVFFVLFGGTVVWQDTVTLTTGSIRRVFSIEFSIAARNSTTLQSGNGMLNVSVSSAPIAGLGTASAGNNAVAVEIATSTTDLTVNTAIAQMFEVSVQWGTASTQAEVVRKFAVCTLS